MTEFDVSPFRTSSIAYLHGIRGLIEIDPPYQRQGEVWSVAKQQLLIDSIINGFDIPKIYFHEHATRKEIDGQSVKYSLVDGRQRLEAIWDFLDGKFALSPDFAMTSDGDNSASGLSYSELSESFPDVAALLIATSLNVMLIRTTDIELIEEMFSRLNEAVPLNAAEKRNGRGGPLRAAVRESTESLFFVDRVPFSNRRYRHFDLATKFLYWTDGGIADAKKRQLDDYWEDYKRQGGTPPTAQVLKVLERMNKTFTSSDRLLASVGMISVYFLLYAELFADGGKPPLRTDLQKFNTVRRQRRPESEDDLTPPQQELLEFDRLAQSPNDSGALAYRLNVLKKFLADPQAYTPVP